MDEYELREALAVALNEIAARDRVLAGATELINESKKAVKVFEIQFDNKAEWTAAAKNKYPDVTFKAGRADAGWGDLSTYIEARTSAGLVGEFYPNFHGGEGFLRLSPSEQMDEAPTLLTGSNLTAVNESLGALVDVRGDINKWKSAVKAEHPDVLFEKPKGYPSGSIGASTTWALVNGKMVGSFTMGEYVELDPGQGYFRKAKPDTKKMDESTGPIAQALAFMKTGKSSALVKK